MTSCASRSASTARAEPDSVSVFAFVVAAALAAPSCSTPTEAQPFPGACEPLRVLEWTPRAGALDVPRDTPVSIRLDDYPDPDTVGTVSFVITTGVFYHPGRYVVDLVDKTISIHAAGNLRGELGYDAAVRPSLLSLRGCAAVDDHRTFRTAKTPPMPPPPAPRAVPFSEVRPIFARSCAGAACHRAEAADDGGAQAADDGGAQAADDSDCLARPAAALSLCDRDAVRALVDVPSLQVSRLRLVAPNDSSRSYLLRKLLPGDTPDRPAPTTLGHRDPPGAPLSRDELHAIAEWIDSGANP